MLSLHDVPLLEACEHIRTAHATKMLSLRKVRFLQEDHELEKRESTASRELLIDLDGPKTEIVSCCIRMAGNVTSFKSRHDDHVYSLHLPPVHTLSELISEASVGMQMDDTEGPTEMQTDDRATDASAGPSKRKEAELSVMDRWKSRNSVSRRRTFESAVLLQARNTQDEERAKKSKRELDQQISMSNQSEAKRQRDKNTIVESLTAEFRRSSTGMDVAKEAVARSKKNRTGDSITLPVRNPDFEVLVVDTEDGRQVVASEKDRSRGEIYEHSHWTMKKWKDLTQEQQIQFEAYARVERPGDPEDSSVSAIAQTSPPEAGFGFDSNDSDVVDPAMSLLLVGVMDYKRKYGSAPPASYIKLFNVSDELKSVLARYGVNFNEEKEQVDKTRSEHLRHHDMDIYYSYTRLLASLVEAKQNLEQSDADNKTPGRSANGIEWLDGQIRTFRRKQQDQLAIVENRLKTENVMKAVGNTDEWRAVKSMYTKPDLKQLPRPQEDPAKIMVKYTDKSANSTLLNTIFEQWQTNFAKGMYSDAENNRISWIALQREIGKQRDFHEARAQEVHAELKIERKKRNVCIRKVSALMEQSVQSKEKFNQEADKLGTEDWCMNFTKLEEKESELYALQQDLRTRVMVEEEQDELLHSIERLDAQVKDCKANRSKLMKLADLAAKEELLHFNARTELAIIDYKLRLLTNKWYFHKNYEKKNKETRKKRRERARKSATANADMKRQLGESAKNQGEIERFKKRRAAKDHIAKLKDRVKTFADGVEKFEKLKKEADLLKFTYMEEVKLQTTREVMQADERLKRARSAENKLYAELPKQGSDLDRALNEARDRHKSLLQQNPGVAVQKINECQLLYSKLEEAEKAFGEFADERNKTMAQGNTKKIKSALHRFFISDSNRNSVTVEIEELKLRRKETPLTKEQKKRAKDLNAQFVRLVSDVRNKHERLVQLSPSLQTHSGRVEWMRETRKFEKRVEEEESILKEKVKQATADMHDCFEIVNRSKNC